MQQFVNNAIFWVEVEKIKPNPYQPRRDFDEARLQELADSIRMYGVLQPLVVTRREITRDDGGLFVEYELISGERRLRASRLAGVVQVPVIIRLGEESDREKLEIAIIENLQREDLNPVDRARAFLRLVEEFGFKHADIGKKIGKSREYVSNTMRILDLPEEMLQALSEGKINEGHTRPLLMLGNRPEEQRTLLKDIVFKKLTVRDAEGTARRIAVERARKRIRGDPELRAFEQKFGETLGTRVTIERIEAGGKIHIDFFSHEDLRAILERIETHPLGVSLSLRGHLAAHGGERGKGGESVSVVAGEAVTASLDEGLAVQNKNIGTAPPSPTEGDEGMYAVKNFSI